MVVLILIAIAFFLIIYGNSSNANSDNNLSNYENNNRNTNGVNNNVVIEKRKDVLDEILDKDISYTVAKIKHNWLDYFKVAKTNSVKSLYHFTDRKNLESIKRNGGLYSWDFCEKNNILITNPGGDSLSRTLDRRHRLENYVRLSFSRNHPMMYVAKKQNRIENPIILEIDPEVIFWKNTKFSDKNATRNDVNVGQELVDFERIKFHIVQQSTQLDLSEVEKPYYQAEILVMEKIPLEFIKNLHLL